MATPSGYQKAHRRATNACQHCKKRKIKCSGDEPCQNCSRRQIPCVFEEADRKILVSEKCLLSQPYSPDDVLLTQTRYLQDLKKRRRETSQDATARSNIDPRSPTSSTNIDLNDFSHDVQAPSNNDGQPPSAPRDQQTSDAISNPLVSHTSTYVRDAVGRFRKSPELSVVSGNLIQSKGFLGPSSTWTFSQRVFTQLKDSFVENQSIQIPLHVDGTAYYLEWTCADPKAPLDTSDLPSLDYTLYLMNAVKFHTCQMFRPFDEEEFTKNLHEFNEHGLDKIQHSRLWFVQFLLIIALGKAMVVFVKDPTTAPGSIWFQRAMALMPDLVQLQREPNLAVQVLCLVSLYLVSVDMKEAAYGYIGQAVRICLLEGLHREIPRQVVGDKLANHLRDIWWTVYILDSRLSSMVGSPSSTQDADVTCPLPSEGDGSNRGIVLTIHVKISRLMTRILNSVYSVERLGRPFVKIIQAVLRDMASMAQELDVVFTSVAYGSIGAVSTVAGHINLSYHHCILLATRPLLLHIMIARLDGTLGPVDLDKSLLPQTKSLLNTCLQSARMTLKILQTLYEHHLLDLFLPFDLESVFSATFILTMASAVVPAMIPDAAAFRSIGDQIIEYLIRKGNVPAKLRKQEISCLDQLIFTLKIQTQGALPAANPPPDIAIDFPELALHSGWTAAPGESGLSPSHMLDIANQLDAHDQAASIDKDWTSTSPWAWWFEHHGTHETQYT